HGPEDRAARPGRGSPGALVAHRGPAGHLRPPGPHEPAPRETRPRGLGDQQGRQRRAHALRLGHARRRAGGGVRRHPADRREPRRVALDGLRARCGRGRAHRGRGAEARPAPRDLPVREPPRDRDQGDQGRAPQPEGGHERVRPPRDAAPRALLLERLDRARRPRLRYRRGRDHGRLCGGHAAPHRRERRRRAEGHRGLASPLSGPDRPPPAPSAPAPPPAGESRLPGFLAAFGFRSFRLLWTGAFLSSLGTWTQDVALAWLIHTGLGDPVCLGRRQFAADLPLLTFMLVGGAVADRVDRRRILLTSQFVQMTLALVLGVLYATDRLGIAAILVVAFLTGLAQSQSAPTYQAVITTLVPPVRIPNAVALNSLQFNLSRAIGPAIAAVILARAGTGWCFAVNAVSFVAVMVALRRIALPKAAAAPGRA